MTNSADQHQVDIFSPNMQQRHFAELCNALYERELHALSKKAPNSISLLQRRLSGLPYHIKNAAEYLLNNAAPIAVDVHNGSWQAKQAAKALITRHDAEKSIAWYASQSKMGLPVPLYINEMGQESIELDSIDRIDLAEHRVHLNKHGWFQFSGEQELLTPIAHNQKVLLKPTKATLTAACCGHTWNHKGRSTPRALSLRELLLSTKINWSQFR